MLDGVERPLIIAVLVVNPPTDAVVQSLLLLPPPHPVLLLAVSKYPKTVLAARTAAHVWEALLEIAAPSTIVRRFLPPIE
jgi:hypothetical protein